jgi:hypothetical protein
MSDLKRVGYVRVNGRLAADLGHNIGNRTLRGFNVMQLNTTDCSTLELRNFDTHGQSASAMLEYFAALPINTTLLGVTIDEATDKLTLSARRTLSASGINVRSLGYRGKLVFVATIGRPELSWSRAAGVGGRNLLAFYSLSSAAEGTGKFV